jgi:hypothetical protein
MHLFLLTYRKHGLIILTSIAGAEVYEENFFLLFANVGYSATINQIIANHVLKIVLSSV